MEQQEQTQAKLAARGSVRRVGRQPTGGPTADAPPDLTELARETGEIGCDKVSTRSANAGSDDEVPPSSPRVSAVSEPVLPGLISPSWPVAEANPVHCKDQVTSAAPPHRAQSEVRSAAVDPLIR